MILMTLGIIVGLIGAVWFIVLAFKENIGWGLGVILIPLVNIIFFLMHINKTWKPVALHILGFLLFIPGFIEMRKVFEESRMSQPVPLQFDRSYTMGQQAYILIKLKESGIKANFAMDRIFVPNKDQVRAKSFVAANPPPEDL